MKLSSTLLLVCFLLLACNGKQENNYNNEASQTEYTGPIIDMHIHAFGSEVPIYGFEHPKTLRGESFQGVATPEEQKRETIKRFKKYNIVKAVVTDGYEWQLELPETILIGVGQVPIDQLRKQHEEGKLDLVAELAPFYYGVNANDPSMMPYFELAEEFGIPVGFHLFPGGPNGGLYSGLDALKGMRAQNANPLQIEDALVNYPNTKVYLMHGGWPYIEDLKALMYVHPQLYVDISVINWILPEKEFHNYLKALIDSGFGDRIMYGTDQMVWPETIDIGIASVNNAPLTIQQKEDIFYNNAARFLGLSEEEIKKHRNQKRAE
jgi:hypothetical protein